MVFRCFVGWWYGGRLGWIISLRLELWGGYGWFSVFSVEVVVREREKEIKVCVGATKSKRSKKPRKKKEGGIGRTGLNHSLRFFVNVVRWNSARVFFRNCLGLKQIGNIHGHLLNRRIVECLNVHQRSLVLLRHEVDSGTLAAETTTATDTMDVILAIGRQIVVDDQGDLLDVYEIKRFLKMLRTLINSTHQYHGPANRWWSGHAMNRCGIRAWPLITS